MEELVQTKRSCLLIYQQSGLSKSTLLFLRSVKIWAFLLPVLLVSCTVVPANLPTAGATDPLATPTAPGTQPEPIPTTSEPVPAYRTPAQNSAWQIQYTGDIETGLNVDVYNLDLFDTVPETIAGLHKRNIFVMCYFSGGSHEDWRPDAAEFPANVLGNGLDGWPGERWLDIRAVRALQPLMNGRLDLAVEKGCDGVDPDNMDGYTNDTGFPLDYEDQLTYNILMAESAHARNLSIGLKNDLEQIADLVTHFDWALNEQCFFYRECQLLEPFILAGKPVFNIEYELDPGVFCPQAVAMRFNSLHKNLELDEYRMAC
jgi:hypothetical protein